MIAYVVNLASAIKRKKYVTDILSGINGIQINWIEAVDGRILSEQAISNTFDIIKFRNHYLKAPRPGEIGCTLSHQKCYNSLLRSTHKSAIIFEDDIVLNCNLNEIVSLVEEFLNVNEPRLLLLSGWFWYSSKSFFDNEHDICKVVDGYLTHAYALNREAAEIMSDSFPYYLADAWEIFRKKGVKIFGLSPHIVDQEWSGVFTSDVLTAKHVKSNFRLHSWLRNKHRGLKQRIIKWIGHFEAPQDMNNRIDNIKDMH